MSVSDFPALNAGLNSLCTIFLLLGWWFIVNQRKTQHICCMVAALITSTIFLSCYLYYHYHVGSVRFTAQGIVRPIYFFILITHLILAIVIVPMIILTVIPAFRSRFDKHRRIGKWTMPTWLYVSVTGVLVYLMLYVWFPSTAIAAK